MKTLTWPVLPPEQPSDPRPPGYIKVAQQLTLALVLWTTHFFHSRQFGLYEDDWSRVPRIIGVSWHGLWAMVEPALVTVSGQGRPLHTTFILTLSFIGFRMGHLPGVYVAAFLVLLTNTFLFQAFLNKVFLDRRFAFLGALVFTLFPADTTQAFLTHALGLQTALTLLLIGFLLYLSKWRPLSYVVVALVLFTYETPYLLFAAAPLIPRPSRRAVLRHWFLMGLILAGVAVLREVSADDRVSHLDKKDLVLGLSNVITGPITCLAMYVYRPITALLFLRGRDVVIEVALCVALVLLLTALFFPSGSLGEQRTKLPVEPSAMARRQWVLGGLLLLLAYPLTLTTTGIAVAGRGTRSHTAAALGGSILCAWACSFVLSRPVAQTERVMALLGVGCFLGLLVGSGLLVQRDYVLSWQEERGFWTDLVALCPSLHEADVIFVEPTGLRDTRQLLFLRKELTGVPDTRQIKSLDEVYRVLPDLYTFPADWKSPPRVLRLPLNWRSKLLAGSTLRPLTIEEGFAYVPGSLGPVPASHAIFLTTENGRLARLDSLVDPQTGAVLKLSRNTAASSTYPEAPVYPYVIEPGGHAENAYLVPRTTK